MELKKISILEFEKIYQDMTKQFPKSELKPIEHMKEILSGGNYSALQAAENGTDVGYIIVCRCGRNLFAEYLAVFKEFHSHGFGSRIIKSLKDSYPDSLGCYFEVEQENLKDPNTSRRIHFYENIGCRLLTKDYFLPYPGGSIPMNLYYLPHKDRNSVPFDEVLSDLTTVFPVIYGKISSSQECIQKFKICNNKEEFIL